MTTTRKHWSEIGRVKNSEWFRGLPKLEQASVLAALEESTHQSAVKLRAMLTLLYFSIIYGIAIAAWASVFHGSTFWFGAGGVSFGAVFGLVFGFFILRQRTPRRASAVQAIAGIPMGFGVLIGVVGLLFLLFQ